MVVEKCREAKKLSITKFNYILESLLLLPNELKTVEDLLNQRYMQNWDLNSTFHVSFDESILNLDCRLSKSIRSKNIDREYVRPPDQDWNRFSNWRKMVSSVYPVPKNVIPGKQHKGLMGLNICVKVQVPRENCLQLTNPVNDNIQNLSTKYRGYLLRCSMRFYEPMQWIKVGSDHVRELKRSLGCRDVRRFHFVLDGRFSSEKIFFGLSKECMVTMSMKNNYVFQTLNTCRKNAWRVAFNTRKMCIASFWRGKGNEEFKVYTNVFLPQSPDVCIPQRHNLLQRPTWQEVTSQRRTLRWPDSIPPLENLLRRNYYQLVRLFDSKSVNEGAFCVYR